MSKERKIPATLADALKESEGLFGQEAYKKAEEINNNNKDLHASVKKEQVEVKQVLRG